MLQAVEVFCPAADAWRAAPPMACPRTSLAAAALGGRLYAVGGQDTRSTHASVEVFEPGAGRWVTLGAAMQHPRKYLGLAAAGGRLVAVGGMTGARMRLPAAEALDPREGRWAALPPMSVARSSAGVAALHECVYVVGGNVGMNINEVGGWCAWVRVRCVCGGGCWPSWGRVPPLPCAWLCCLGCRVPLPALAGSRPLAPDSPPSLPCPALLGCRRTTRAWRCGCRRRGAGATARPSATGAPGCRWRPSDSGRLPPGSMYFPLFYVCAC